MSGLLQDGVELMLIGMAVVFALLGVMVVAVRAMSAFASILAPVEPAPQGIGGAGVQNSELIAAITGAVQAYRRTRSG